MELWESKKLHAKNPPVGKIFLEKLWDAEEFKYLTKIKNMYEEQTSITRTNWVPILLA